MNEYNSSDPTEENRGKPIIIGHRGAAGHFVENTLNSFSRAVDIGVDMIELDVRLTKDNEIVVFHDRKTKRMTGQEHSIRLKTHKELMEHRLSDGSFIPTLKEVLDLLNNKVRVNIEIKEGGMTHQVAELVDYYIKKRGWPAESFNISSFRHKELIKFKNILPAVPISILFHKVPGNAGQYIEKFGVYSVNFWKNHITREIVDDIKKRNAKVFVYTINKPEELNHMLKLGVDGIFSDYPDQIKKLIALHEQTNVILPAFKYKPRLQRRFGPA